MGKEILYDIFTLSEHRKSLFKVAQYLMKSTHFCLSDSSIEMELFVEFMARPQ